VKKPILIYTGHINNESKPVSQAPNPDELVGIRRNLDLYGPYDIKSGLI
jgi:hypothetical protein